MEWDTYLYSVLINISVYNVQNKKERDRLLFRDKDWYLLAYWIYLSLRAGLSNLLLSILTIR